MRKSLKSVAKPETRFDVVRVEKNGEPVIVRVMLLKYDSVIEVYYQEEGYPFEFSYGVASSEGWTKTMSMALVNAPVWGLHYEEEEQ